MLKNKKGFTLIELLIVIGIIAILAAIIFVAVDPARRLAEARNADRWGSVNAILNAYLKSTVDNDGTQPVSNDTDGVALVNGTTYEIGTALGTAASCTASAALDQVDLTTLVTDGYLSAMPADPQGGTTASTGYYFVRSANGNITIGACEPEQGESISVQR